MKILLGLTLLGFVFFQSSCRVGVQTKSNSKELLRDQIVAASMGEIGKPYKFGGTGPTAYDCSGLVYAVYHKSNIALPRTSKELSKVGKSISIRRASPGDLLFFSSKRKISHVGIVVSNTGGELQMIHASTSKGVILESVNRSPYWSKRLRKARRILG